VPLSGVIYQVLFLSLISSKSWILRYIFIFMFLSINSMFRLFRVYNQINVIVCVSELISNVLFLILSIEESDDILLHD